MEMTVEKGTPYIFNVSNTHHKHITLQLLAVYNLDVLGGQIY